MPISGVMRPLPALSTCQAGRRAVGCAGKGGLGLECQLNAELAWAPELAGGLEAVKQSSPISHTCSSVGDHALLPWPCSFADLGQQFLFCLTPCTRSLVNSWYPLPLPKLTSTLQVTTSMFSPGLLMEMPTPRGIGAENFPFPKVGSRTGMAVSVQCCWVCKGAMEEAKQSWWGRQVGTKGGCCDIQGQDWEAGRAEERKEGYFLSAISVTNLRSIQVCESGGADGHHHTDVHLGGLIPTCSQAQGGGFGHAHLLPQNQRQQSKEGAEV